MASLTPGVLSKLLDNVGNRDAKVAGEHRSALLQVIGIVPSLVGGDDAGGGDPWRSKGFFLRVSDSVHSAYVSISDEDVDLVLNDEIQLGQFVHVARLDSASPVPVLRGVKPVPRRRPCVGNPKDLISSDSILIPSEIDFSAAVEKKKQSKIVQREGTKKPKNLVSSDSLLISRRNDFSAAAVEKGAKNLVKRPEERAKRSVMEEGKWRRLSMENGKVEGLELRRLSLDSTRKGWDRSLGTKSSNPWTPSLSKAKEISTSKTSAFVRIEVQSSWKAFSDKDSVVKRPNSNVSPLKNKNENVSQKFISKPLGKDLKSSCDGTIPSHLAKVPLSFKTWSDRKVSWDSLPGTIRDLGKEAMGHRDHAFLAAVYALEEASAAECVIRCMSSFAELCQSSQKDSAGNLVEQFLNLHQSIQKAATVVDALLSTRLQEPKTSPYSHHPLSEIRENLPNENAISWVVAAVETDLSKFSLYRKEEKRGNINGEKCHLVVLENSAKNVESENHSPQCKQSPRSHGSSLSESRAKGPSPTWRRLSAAKRTDTQRVGWSKGSGLKEAATLAEKLLVASREWFLNYLEQSLNTEFGMRMGEAGSEIASLLRQLKRVNQWLDETVVDGKGADDRIEDLKKKLYGFLLDHFDSAMLASR